MPLKVSAGMAQAGTAEGGVRGRLKPVVGFTWFPSRRGVLERYW